MGLQLAIETTDWHPKSKYKKVVMISDKQILYMYKSILVPWEIRFGKDSSKLPLDSEIAWPNNVVIRQTERKNFPQELRKIKRANTNQYLVFVKGDGKKSSTLFYLLRCAFAHSMISTQGNHIMIRGKNRNGKVNLDGRLTPNGLKAVMSSIGTV